MRWDDFKFTAIDNETSLPTRRNVLVGGCIQIAPLLSENERNLSPADVSDFVIFWTANEALNTFSNSAAHAIESPPTP